MTKVIHPEAEYATFVAQGRLMLQRSASTGAYVFFPRIAEPGSRLADLEWVEASGAGTVYSFTITRNRPPAEDYVIALIDLAEGVRMMSRVVDCDPASMSIGIVVQARSGTIDDTAAILFVPVQGDLE